MRTFILALLLTFAVCPCFYGQTLASQGNGEPRHELILAPDAFGKLAAQHISQMYVRGYFRHLSRNDFDHGHLVFRVGSPETFVSLEDALAHAALTLYHTDESGVVLDSDGPLDPGKRRQRSIVGLPDGRIRPAIELFSAPYQDFYDYICCGTIHVMDFWRLIPKQFKHNMVIRIVSRTGTQWLASQFMITKSATGRYRVANIYYDIYFESPREK